MSYELHDDIIEELKEIQETLDSFHKDFTNMEVIKELTHEEMIEGIEEEFNDLGNIYELCSLDDLLETLKDIYQVYREDNFGESLPDKYKTLIEDLTK